MKTQNATRDVRMVIALTTGYFLLVTAAGVRAGSVAVEGNMNIASNLTVLGNFTGGTNNTATGTLSFIGGGTQNRAGSYSVVGGGANNVASNAFSVIGGGSQNISSGYLSFVGGGGANTGSGYYSFVGGGLYNVSSGQASFVGGGANNKAGGNCSAIVGGSGNLAAGQYATVPGGYNGYADHDYTFVWADGTATHSSTNNEFTVHASNGFRFLGGDVTIDGKINLGGVVDPPGLLLDATTRAAIARRTAREVPPAKATGAMLFFNAATKRVEVYVASEGAFYNLDGKLITNITPPAIAGQSVTNYMIDADSGDVTPQISYRVPRWQVKDGYRFNRADGTFQAVTHTNVLQTVTHTDALGPVPSFILTNEVEVVRPATKTEALELR